MHSDGCLDAHLHGFLTSLIDTFGKIKAQYLELPMSNSGLFAH